VLFYMLPGRIDGHVTRDEALAVTLDTSINF